MSLFQKLEGDSLKRTCEAEVQELHQIFVSWFQATRTKSILSEELTSRLDPNFSHIAPNGSALKGRHSLISTLDEKYGCYRDRKFTIDVYDFQLIWNNSNQCLCTYEEWQSWQQENEKHQFGRLSTCLLVKQANRWKWMHVHETWLEEEAPRHPLHPTAVSNARNNTQDIDNDTIMTGPVLPSEVKKREKDKETDAPVLLLVSSQSLSREILQKQSLVETTLRGKGIHYDKVDAAEPTNKERRDELVAMSGKTGAFPQIFVKQDGETSFWGTYEHFEESNENGTLKEDLGLDDDGHNGAAKVAALAAVGAGIAGAAAVMANSNKNKNSPPPAERSANAVSPDPEPKMNGKAIAAGTGVAAAAAGAAAAAAIAANSDEEDEEGSIEFGPEPEESDEDMGSQDEDSGEGEDDEDDESEPYSSEEEDGPMTKEERQFLEASQGILVFEEEEEKPVSPLPPAKTNIKELQTPPDASTKRHVSPKLEEYANPLAWDNALIGVSIAGFDIGTSQGPIADEAWYTEVGAELENTAQSKSMPRPRRKIALPEMVFPTAHVALEGHGYWLSWDVVDALQEWAVAHQQIAIHSSSEYRGVQVLKSKDAKLWAEKNRKIADNSDASSVFHYDWTYSTPFCGNVEGGHWTELDESGMRTELLTDTSIPILFFDEVVLFEDDLHDNGQVQYVVKMRAMPSCAYVLSRLYLRVDNVIIKIRETRLLVDFFGLKPQVYRDVTWREAKWEDLSDLGLPTDPKAWSFEKETRQMHEQIKKLPEAKLPADIFKFAILHPGSPPIKTQAV